MSIVNCKVQYIRPKYNNLKEWMNDPNNIYIGRGGVVFIDKKRFPTQASKFANPYKVGKHGTREEVIDKYKTYITQQLKDDKNFQKELVSIKGKNLGCWCYPCHGHVLLDFIKNY
jgi:hypothetical protein